MANQPRPVPVPGTPPGRPGPVPTAGPAKPPTSGPATVPPAAPGGPGAGVPPEEEVIVHSSFWQSQLVQDVLPFITSLLIHLGVVVLIVVTYKVVEKFIEPPREQVVVPDTTLNEGPEGGIPHPGLGGDKDRDAAQDKIPDVPADAAGWSDKQTQNMTSSLMGGGGGDTEGEAPIGVGGGAAGKGSRVGSGSGTGLGSGDGDGGGPIAPFGVPGGGGGIGPKSNFFGVGGNARFVAYVCDASGSMLQRFDELRQEITKSVSNLKTTQAFNVVFFQEAPARSLSSGGLVLANPENKDKTGKFLEGTTAHGSTNPIPGLEIAFKQKPQLIFLLTDGDFPDNEEVLKWIREHNQDKKIKINTIAYITGGEDPEKVLKQIAAENGGQFRKVTDKD